MNHPCVAVTFEHHVRAITLACGCLSPTLRSIEKSYCHLKVWQASLVPGSRYWHSRSSYAGAMGVPSLSSNARHTARQRR